MEESVEGGLCCCNEEVKGGVRGEGIREDEEKEVLVRCIEGDEVGKIKGCKCGNSGGLCGIGVSVKFSDCNVWKELKGDMSDEEGSCKNGVYRVDIEKLEEGVVNKGDKDIVVKIGMVREYKDEEGIGMGKKGEKEKSGK